MAANKRKRTIATAAKTIAHRENVYLKTKDLYPEQRGCCDRPDWVVGFLFCYCKNCDAVDY